MPVATEEKYGRLKQLMDRLSRQKRDLHDFSKMMEKGDKMNGKELWKLVEERKGERADLAFAPQNPLFGQETFANLAWYPLPALN